MPPYLASKCALNTCTRFRAMMARRTRRISSSLLPLNITPAITSIHPPLWWNGPLGPLTSDRDLYAVSSRGLVCRTIPGDAEDAAYRLATYRFAAYRFAHLAPDAPSVPRSARDPLDPVRRAQPRAVL